MSKIPSNASIRRALSTLKKAKILNIDTASIQTELKYIYTAISIPIELLSPKKSLKRRLPKVKKVNI